MAKHAQRARDKEGSVTEYLACRVAMVQYAIPVSLVREIVRSAHITRVPRAPESVLGVTSFRGRIVTIVDLARRLGLACAVLPPPDRKAFGAARALRVRILMVEAGGEIIGLLVDEVLIVHRLSDKEIERAVHAVGSDVGDHVLGMARPVQGGEVVQILDVKMLLEGGS
jgi:purine-binding chemotaxis protein CheW